jgi:hypothetical protein
VNEKKKLRAVEYTDFTSGSSLSMKLERDAHVEMTAYSVETEVTLYNPSNEDLVELRDGAIRALGARGITTRETAYEAGRAQGRAEAFAEAAETMGVACAAGEDRAENDTQEGD